MRLEGFIIAGLAGLAIVGACGQDNEITGNGDQLLDVHDGRLMPNQCEQGLYEFRCDDGAWEVRTLEEIEAGDVCHVLHVKAQDSAFILERLSNDENNCVITDRETLRVSRIVPDFNSTNDLHSRYYVQVVKAPGSNCNLTEGFVQAKNVKVLAPNGKIYPSDLSFPLLDWEEDSLSHHDAWIREYKQKRRYTQSQCHNGPAQPWNGGSWGSWSAPSGSYIPAPQNGEVWVPPQGAWEFDGRSWIPPEGAWRSNLGRHWIPATGSWAAPYYASNPEPGLWMPPPNESSSRWGWTVEGSTWGYPSGSYNGGWGYPSGSYSGNWGGWMAPSGSWTPADQAAGQKFTQYLSTRIALRDQ